MFFLIGFVLCECYSIVSHNSLLLQLLAFSRVKDLWISNLIIMLRLVQCFSRYDGKFSGTCISYNISSFAYTDIYVCYEMELHSTSWELLRRHIRESSKEITLQWYHIHGHTQCWRKNTNTRKMLSKEITKFHVWWEIQSEVVMTITFLYW